MVESKHVRVGDLFADVKERYFVGAPGAEVSSVSYRSDQCSAGSLFFCVPGFTHDGHEFAEEAIRRGAVALCCERQLPLPVSQVVVPSVRAVMGPVSSRFFGDPSSRLLTAGITGTNGKTTSAFLVAHFLSCAGLPAGLLGTVCRRIGGECLPAGRTTPEAPDIQRDLALMLQRGDKAAVMEVSSHALDLDRVRGVQFRVVAFTNLTQDHLDYHGDLESYFAAKRRLFVDEDFLRGGPLAVVNLDDSYGQRLASLTEPDRLLTFSVAGVEGAHGKADLEMTECRTSASGLEGTLVLRGNAWRLTAGREQEGRHDEGPGREGSPQISLPVRSCLVGDFNVANILTAVGIGLGLGLDPRGMVSALSTFPGVPGRMETVEGGQPFAVIVDYAHTPASVENVLRTARSFTSGRLIAVFGCGGDRDRSKRPQMGRAAEELADLVVVTSDNPRSEDPQAIIAAILDGFATPERAVVEPDRQLAIEFALRQAEEGDVVLILGKGHESGQEFAKRTVPFDDRLVALRFLEEQWGQGR